MGLVQDHEEVVGEVVEQRVGPLARRASVEVGAVVLDAVAEAQFRHHLQVVLGAHAQPLGLQQFLLTAEQGKPIGQLGFDARDGVPDHLAVGHVVGGREHDQFVHQA